MSDYSGWMPSQIRTEAARSKGQWAESRFSPEVVSPEGRMIVNATAVA